MNALKSAALISLTLIICGWIWLFNCPVPTISIVFQVLGFFASARARQLYEEDEFF